jgi:hypothetical protein
MTSRLVTWPFSSALEKLHHEVGPAVGQDAERENVDDVGVPDLIDGAGLLEKALGHLLVARPHGGHHLDGDLLANERLHALVHRPHAAFTELALDYVLADLGAAGQVRLAGRGVAHGKPRAVIGRKQPVLPRKTNELTAHEDAAIRHRIQVSYGLPWSVDGRGPSRVPWAHPRATIAALGFMEDRR